MMYDAKTLLLLTSTLHGPRASRLSHKWKGNEDREYEVSKIFGNDFSSRGTASNFLTHVESKTNQFENVVSTL